MMADQSAIVSHWDDPSDDEISMEWARERSQEGFPLLRHALPLRLGRAHRAVAVPEA